MIISAHSLPVTCHSYLLHFPLNNTLVAADSIAEKGRFRIIAGIVPLDAFPVEVCVAVPAAVKAGVVGADVDAFHAAAGGPLRFVLFPDKGPAGDAGDERIVDAFAGGYDVCEGLIGADREVNIVVLCDCLQ